ETLITLPIFSVVFASIIYFVSNANDTSNVIVIQLQGLLGKSILQDILTLSVIIHILEAFFILFILIKWGVYDPKTLITWVGFTLLFGHGWHLWIPKSSTKPKTT
ncbi:9961_t:CDS:1, partial [Funneliformis mosseae]